MASAVQVQLTVQAEADLQTIYNQRVKQRGAAGPDGADALLDSLYAAMEELSSYPQRGPTPPELEAIGIADWRQISAWPYRIIYTATAERVTIAIIADSRRDFAGLLERRILRRG